MARGRSFQKDSPEKKIRWLFWWCFACSLGVTILCGIWFYYNPQYLWPYRFPVLIFSTGFFTWYFAWLTVAWLAKTNPFAQYVLYVVVLLLSATAVYWAWKLYPPDWASPVGITFGTLWLTLKVIRINLDQWQKPRVYQNFLKHVLVAVFFGLGISISLYTINFQ